jgi:hypothetical protein
MNTFAFIRKIYIVEVADHEHIMRAYEFYNWKMSFTDEKEKED